MLDSMVYSPTPTRAEASDVATAIYDGADAAMLSAESATGDYPEESVRMMDSIIRATEGHKLYNQQPGRGSDRQGLSRRLSEIRGGQQPIRATPRSLGQIGAAPQTLGQSSI